MRRGQALVVVLMVLAVSMAVGFSIASRTTTEVAISTAQEDSAQALSAAEAGIERILSGDLSAIPTGTAGYSYQLLPTPTNSPISQIDLPDQIKSGEATVLHLVQNYRSGPPFGTTFESPFYVCWGGLDEIEESALQTDLYYYRPGDSTYRVAIQGYDIYAASRGNRFVSTGITSTEATTAANCPPGRKYHYSRQITFNDAHFPGYLSTDEPLFIRFKLLYNYSASQYIGLRSFSPSPAFSVQGNIYTVQGISNNASRRVELDQRSAEPFTIFENALFSGGGVTLQ